MKYRLSFLLVTFFIFFSSQSRGEDVKFNTPGAGNPIIPGYFADPTVVKFGDTYYLYATTDGNGGGLGPSQVWISKDFVNWFIRPMNWPSTHHIWAPDVMKGKDGRYYFYYCQPCQIYCGVSDTPIGPWTNILGDEEAVLVPDRYVPMSITLDGQTFTDDDGSVYLYWGTWGIYSGHGCGVGKFNEDMVTFADTALIPNTDAIDFFEAPFVFKRNGIYYFTYSSGSCHDHTYRVQYATSTVGPMGPFVYADNNPILETNADGTIHGPGHHSIIQEGDDYYIVYHRHDIPLSTRGMHRQIAADRLTFDAEGRIKKINAGHEGVGYLQKNTNPYPNKALGKKVTASSYYDERFLPEYAVDDNNGTLWRPATAGEEWIEIDLGSVTQVRRIWTQFEYATSFYQYLIETSVDGNKWEIFADRRNNTRAGSPMMDTGKAKARYVRLIVTGNEKNGLFGAIWNIKIFDKGTDPVLPEYTAFNGQSQTAAPARKGLIFEVNANDYPLTGTVSSFRNRADQATGFTAQGQSVPVRLKENKAAFIFNGTQEFRSDFSLPETMTGNSPYSVVAWIYPEDLVDTECLVDLTNGWGELEKVSIGYGTNPQKGIISHNGGYEDMGLPELPATNRWLHLSVTFDGYMERIYIDGKEVKQKDVVLRLPKSDFVTIGNRLGEKWPFRNSLHSLTLYDIPLTAEEVSDLYGKGIADSPFLADAKLMNDLKEIDVTPVIRVISPEIARIEVNGGNNPYGLQFSYENSTSNLSSGWVREPVFYDTSLSAGKTSVYHIRVKDTFGNEQDLEPVEITVSPDMFEFIQDQFTGSQDLVTEGISHTIWSGLAGVNPDGPEVRRENEELSISSQGRHFQPGSPENGPFLYYETPGDFLAQVEISGFNGMEDRKTVSFNEGGLMVSIDDPADGRERDLMHLGIFPYYNVGNILTYFSPGRIQHTNNKAWELDRFLQVEKSGNKFYFRTSPDGKNWNDMPGSPVISNFPDTEKVKVGLYQVTYTPEKGTVNFRNFKLWRSK